jgi:hypothetical protein
MAIITDAVTIWAAQLLARPANEPTAAADKRLK